MCSVTSALTTLDVAVAGGGLVGAATAMAMARRGASVAVLEAEQHLAAHQSGHNSGVIHSGLYYKPGSLKAALCVEGARALFQFCAEEGIAHERCGKLVVATREDELPRLAELEERGRANGLAGARRIGPQEIREIEPHAAGIAALWVPETGIVDYPAVARAYGRRIEAAGGQVLTGARVGAVRRDGSGLTVETARGTVRCSYFVNCAGLQADRIARLCGAEPDVRIFPFRGEYYELVPERWDLVRGLIYPVPDPCFPFLGVHLTRRIQGGVEAGPNAVLAWRREGYRKGSFSPRDAAEIVTYPGFWKMAGRFWRTAVRETWRSAFKSAFVRDLQRLLPVLRPEDVRPGGSGVRAQALDRDGRLVDDFRFVESDRAIHVLNAPSPAATASIRIGEWIAERVRAAGVAALAPLILLFGLAGCSGHTIRAEFAPNYAQQGDFNFQEPPCRRSPKPSLGQDEVAIRYLGAGGLYLEWQGTALLMSPFFSNPRVWRVPLGHLVTDEAAVVRGLKGMDLSHVRALAAGHSHYDHIGDLPLVAERFVPGARIYVNASGAHALAAIPALTRRVTSLESEEARSWISLKDSDQNDLPIRFRAVPSKHAPHFWGIHLARGSLAKDWTGEWKTRRYLSLKEGETFAFVIDLRSPDLEETRFRLYYQDAMSPPGQGLPPRLDDGHGYDLAVLCMASFYFVRKQPGTILHHLRPRHLLVTHYEDFFRAGDQPVSFVSLLSDFWANRFFLRARRAMSGWDSGTVGPEGTVCGPSSRSWTMPVPGEWLRFRPAVTTTAGPPRL